MNAKGIAKMSVKIPSDPPMIFTPAKLRALKRLYNAAAKKGYDQFTFNGRTLLVTYARYLIEYLETQFKE